MIDTHLFHGERVRLVAPDPAADAEAVARWSLDSEFARLFGSGPVRPWLAKTAR